MQLAQHPIAEQRAELVLKAPKYMLKSLLSYPASYYIVISRLGNI